MTNIAFLDLSDADRRLDCFAVLHGRPVDHWEDVAGMATPVFVPPLTTAEQAMLADLRTMARFGVTNDLTLAEFQAIKADLALGRAFLDIASPTQAQAVAAERAIIRVLGALLRS